MLAATFDSGADLTMVVAVQTLRVLVLALAAPFAARLLRVRLVMNRRLPADITRTVLHRYPF